jgi:DNA-directed RNA polymerase specialized sigma subunit
LENLRLVNSIYRKTARTTAIRRQKDDLIGEGNLGLAEAAYSWTDGKSTSFKTYASRCIEKKMLAYLKREKRYYELNLPLSVLDKEVG